jgi:signal transduction histidine kinase/DNA-binding response OmpR family regulator
MKTLNDTERGNGPILFLNAAVLFTGIILFALMAQVWSGYQVTKMTKERHLRIEGLRGTIAHLDEVLTMSARMAASTGEPKWKERYQSFEPKLDSAIKEAIKLSPSSYEGEAAEQTDAANMKLVEMEHRSFELVDQGLRDQATELLFSKEYESQKKIYSEGMLKFSNLLEKDVETHLNQQKQRTFLFLVVLGFILPIWVGVWFAILKLLNRWKKAMVAANHQLAKSAEDLTILNHSLDQKVSERTQELEKAHGMAVAASKTKTEFLATMSHEIRTPMNAILGMSELLAESDLPSEQKEYVETLRRNGDHLLNLINDILDLSKVEAGKLELEESVFDLREMIERVTELMAIRAHQKGIELSHYIEGNVPRMVIGDSTRLRQVLVNMVGNAIKFTEKGEVVVEVRSPRRENSKAAELQFTVRDTGIGIPADKLDSIFGAFTQVDSSTTRKYGGTGLGLNISKKLVELMNGKIRVESENGKGTKFHFTVFVQKATESQNENEDNIPRALDKLRILVVDDNDTNRFILREMLKSTGAELVEAEDGIKGLAALEMSKKTNRLFDLILLDCRMPQMDGFQFAEAVQKDPALQGLTIMMLTSDDRRGNIERAKQVGLASYIVKPIKKAELLASIASILQAQKEKAPKPQILSEVPIPQDKNAFKILLVEDNADNRLLIQSYLKKTPYNLEIAEDGLIAFNKIKSQHYDLVLMDLHMPVMDGYEAVKKIREWEKIQGMEHLKIFALSASVLQSEVIKSIQSGCDEHLCKPIKKETLLKVLAECENKKEKAGVRREAA